ncbi:MAG: efflux RND transporter permease subunit [Planctomycetaceae bacterium]|nr:efflux RND transporter permease subunit [Planctomycetaceae bacterium]
MLRAIVQSSLRQPFLVLALAAALLFIGYRNLRNAPLDVFPEFAPPLVEIQTEAPGLSTEEVESLVTVPLENALNGTPDLKTIRSKSVLGLSSIVLLFQEGTDLRLARQLVGERLAIEASRLPVVAMPPVILSPLSSTSRVLKIGIWSDKDEQGDDVMSQMEMSELARWTIRPRLMSVSGVANVAIWGQRDRQYQVLVDPERLRSHNLLLADVERAAGDAALVSGGGFIDTPNQRLPVRHVSAIVTTDDLARSVVAFRDGAPLRLGDVAEIKEGFPPPIGDAIINDVPGLLLIVEKQPTGNTLDVTRNVEAALEEMKPGLKGIQVDSTIFRPATFIEMSLENLGWAMAIGCVLVIVILIVFLWDWRTALISTTAIPLSLVAAALVLRQAGVTINTMVLAGLIIALGEVVDDAIIDVENIVRRLRLNREAGSPKSAFHVVLDASIEVRSAVVYGSFTVMLVIMPVFFLDGLAGSFFRPLALSYVLAIFASLVVALVITPAMSLLLLPGRSDQHRESPLIAFLKRPYRAVLPSLIWKPALSIVALGALLVGTLSTVPYLGEEFLPDFQEYDFLMHWVEKPGTSIEAMDRITVRASQELRDVPGVRNFGSHIGRAEVADEVVGPNFTELWISLDRDVDYQSKVAEIQAIVDGYPGLYRDLLTYLRERVKEVLTGASASIVVRIYGDDIELLRQHASRVRDSIADVEGVSDLKIEQQVLVPQLDVRLRPAAAEQFGLTAGDVRRAATTLIQGRVVGEVYRQQKVFQVAVWGVPDVRGDLSAVRNCLIETPSGGHVLLNDVADIQIVAAPNTIKRENTSRRIDVTCNVRDRDLRSVAEDIESRVRQVEFARGYHPDFLGEYAAQQASRRQMLWMGIVALAGIVVLIYSEFRAWRLVTLVMLSLVFAMIGGVFGVWVGGGSLSLGSLVGFVTVVGIAVRNGIMMISHYRHLEVEEGMEFGVPLAIRGAEERLAPILMTALTAALALLPLVAAGNKPGHEIEYPMALVIVGGLLTSTLMNLFLMPSLYRLFGKVVRSELAE